LGDLFFVNAPKNFQFSSFDSNDVLWRSSLKKSLQYNYSADKVTKSVTTEFFAIWVEKCL